MFSDIGELNKEFDIENAYYGKTLAFSTPLVPLSDWNKLRVFLYSNWIYSMYPSLRVVVLLKPNNGGKAVFQTFKIRFAKDSYSLDRYKIPNDDTFEHVVGNLTSVFKCIGCIPNSLHPKKAITEIPLGLLEPGTSFFPESVLDLTDYTFDYDQELTGYVGATVSGNLNTVNDFKGKISSCGVIELKPGATLNGNILLKNRCEEARARIPEFLVAPEFLRGTLCKNNAVGHYYEHMKVNKVADTSNPEIPKPVIKPSSGTNKVPQMSNFVLFPNPATNTLTISCLIPEQSFSKIQILTSLGSEVFVKELNTPSNSTVIDISAFQPGIYLVKINGISKQLTIIK